MAATPAKAVKIGCPDRNPEYGGYRLIQALYRPPGPMYGGYGPFSRPILASTSVQRLALLCSSPGGEVFSTPRCFCYMTPHCAGPVPPPRPTWSFRRGWFH